MSAKVSDSVCFPAIFLDLGPLKGDLYYIWTPGSESVILLGLNAAGLPGIRSGKLLSMSQRAAFRGPTPNPYEAAIETALRDLAETQQGGAALRAQLASNNQRAKDLAESVRSLLALIEPASRLRYIQQLDELGATQVSSKGGAVLDNVVSILARKKGSEEVTSAELKEQLAENGPMHDPKAIDNVLGYLAKTGQIKRMSRGRYIISGLNLALDLGHDFGAGVAAPEDTDE